MLEVIAPMVGRKKNKAGEEYRFCTDPLSFLFFFIIFTGIIVGRMVGC